MIFFGDIRSEVLKIASEDETGGVRGLDTMTLEKILITWHGRHQHGPAECRRRH